MADPTPPTPPAARGRQPESSSLDHFRSQYLLQLSADLVRHGFAYVPVGVGRCSAPGCDCGDDGDGWSYTVGLAEQGLPELVVIGLAPVVGIELVTRVLRRHRLGGRVALNEPMELDGVQVKLLGVPGDWLAHDLDRMAMWISHYAPGRQALDIPPIAQLLFADGAGRFPDQPGCDPFVAAAQPVLATDPYSYPAVLHRRTRRRSHIRRSAA